MNSQAMRVLEGAGRCRVELVAALVFGGLRLDVGKADDFLQKLRGNFFLSEVRATSTADVGGGVGD